MHPHLEQRLRKLEQGIITAQQRERPIQIRWIGKGERLRPGLHYVSDLLPVKANLPPKANPPAAAPTPDSSTLYEGEEQEAWPETTLTTEDLEAPDAQQPPAEMTFQAPPAKEPDDALD